MTCFVPDLAIVPKLLTSSALVMPKWKKDIDDLKMDLTNSSVHDGQRLVGLVRSDLDVQVLACFQLLRLGQGLVADLVQGVGRVRNEFAQEDFLVAVEGVDDQAHQLRDFGLEGEGFIVLVSHDELVRGVTLKQ